MILSNIFIISAFNLWHGGHCVGYRYILIPGIILGMFSFFFWEKHNRIFKTVIIIILIISVFNGIMSFFIQKDQELLYKTWKSEPLDVHSNYYTELLYPFFTKKDK